MYGGFLSLGSHISWIGFVTVEIKLEVSICRVKIILQSNVIFMLYIEHFISLVVASSRALCHLWVKCILRALNKSYFHPPVCIGALL